MDNKFCNPNGFQFVTKGDIALILASSVSFAIGVLLLESVCRGGLAYHE